MRTATMQTAARVEREAPVVHDRECTSVDPRSDEPKRGGLRVFFDGAGRRVNETRADIPALFGPAQAGERAPAEQRRRSQGVFHEAAAAEQPVQVVIGLRWR